MVMEEFIHPKPAAELVHAIQASSLVYEDENPRNIKQTHGLFRLLLLACPR